MAKESLPKVTSSTAAAEKPDDRPLVALGWMTLSAASFSMMAVFVKRLAPGFPQSELVFFRSSINLVIILTLMIYRGDALFPAGKPLLLFRGTAGFLSVCCLFYSIAHLPMPIATMLSWSSPLFVILFSRLFLKEQLTLRSGLFIALAFAGMVLLLNPDFRSGTASVPLRAAAIAVMGAAFAGMAYVAVRAAASRIGVNAIVLYFVGVSTLASAPLAIPGFVTPTGAQVLELLCLGIVATVGQLTMTQGYRHAPAGIVSMMSLLNPVFGAAFGLIVFRDHLLLIQWMGMVLVGTALAGLTAQSAKGALSKRSAALREVTGRVASVSE